MVTEPLTTSPGLMLFRPKICRPSLELPCSSVPEVTELMVLPVSELNVAPDPTARVPAARRTVRGTRTLAGAMLMGCSWRAGRSVAGPVGVMTGTLRSVVPRLLHTWAPRSPHFGTEVEHLDTRPAQEPVAAPAGSSNHTVVPWPARGPSPTAPPWAS